MPWGQEGGSAFADMPPRACVLCWQYCMQGAAAAMAPLLLVALRQLYPSHDAAQPSLDHQQLMVLFMIALMVAGLNMAKVGALWGGAGCGQHQPVEGGRQRGSRKPGRVYVSCQGSWQQLYVFN